MADGGEAAVGRIWQKNEPAGGSSEGESLGDEPHRLALPKQVAAWRRVPSGR